MSDWTTIRDKRWADHICPEEEPEENDETEDEEEENDDEDE